MIKNNEMTNVGHNFYDSKINIDGQEEHACMKIFRSLDKFFSHQRIHTNDKPYSCLEPGCGASFS